MVEAQEQIKVLKRKCRGRKERGIRRWDCRIQSEKGDLENLASVDNEPQGMGLEKPTLPNKGDCIRFQVTVNAILIFVQIMIYCGMIIFSVFGQWFNMIGYVLGCFSSAIAVLFWAFLHRNHIKKLPVIACFTLQYSGIIVSFFYYLDFLSKFISGNAGRFILIPYLFFSIPSAVLFLLVLIRKEH